MSVLVNDDNYPNTALVYIEADFGFSTYSGSGFIVGPNDIITAAHIPYSSSLKRLADEIRVYPSFDPQTPYNNYYLYANRVEYFPNFDPDGDLSLIHI